MKSIFKICLLVGLLPLFSNFSTSKNEERGPLITAKVSTTTYCKVGKTCGTWLGSVNKRHGFKIILTGASVSFYKSNFVYTVYDAANNQIAQFPCTQSVVEFADAKLANATPYKVVIKDANSSNSGEVKFTTGTGAGTICGGGGNSTGRN